MAVIFLRVHRTVLHQLSVFQTLEVRIRYMWASKVNISSLSIDNCVREYHVCKTSWSAAVGESLQCEREERNVDDAFAVAIVKNCVSNCAFLEILERSRVFKMPNGCRHTVLRSIICNFSLVFRRNLLVLSSRSSFREFHCIHFFLNTSYVCLTDS